MVDILSFHCLFSSNFISRYSSVYYNLVISHHGAIFHQVEKLKKLHQEKGRNGERTALAYILSTQITPSFSPTAEYELVRAMSNNVITKGTKEFLDDQSSISDGRFLSKILSSVSLSDLTAFTYILAQMNFLQSRNY